MNPNEFARLKSLFADTSAFAHPIVQHTGAEIEKAGIPVPSIDFNQIRNLIEWGIELIEDDRPEEARDMFEEIRDIIDAFQSP